MVQRRRGKRGTRSEESRDARRAHACKQKCDDGEVAACWECCTQHVGRTKPGEKTLETKRKAEGKAAQKKNKAARARSRLHELTFGTFSVRTAAVNGANGISHIDTLLRPCAAKGCDVIGLQETNGTELSKSSHVDAVLISAVTTAGSKAEKGNMGLDWR